VRRALLEDHLRQTRVGELGHGRMMAFLQIGGFAPASTTAAAAGRTRRTRQQRPERVRERKGSPLLILRRPRIEPDFPGAEIDVAPFEGEDFARHTPAVIAANRITGRSASGKWVRTAASLSASKKPCRRLSSRNIRNSGWDVQVFETASCCSRGVRR